MIRLDIEVHVDRNKPREEPIKFFLMGHCKNILWTIF